MIELNAFFRWIIEDFIPLKTNVIYSNKNLYAKLNRKFQGCKCYVCDNSINLINKADINKIKLLNLFKYRRWVTDKHDCDDFAFSLKGLVSAIYGNCAFGIVFVRRKNSSNHALNCYINENGKFFYFEPQTNETFTTHSSYKPYLIII